MNAAAILGFSIVILYLAYRTWGGFQARLLGVDPDRKTPAHTHRDGVDYEPAAAPVVLGHHFASIAGAGPIVGPIFAATFGWLPALLWILIGSIFIGATHDFTSLIASLRHGGTTVGQLIERYVGARGKFLFLSFAFATLILVIAVFVNVVQLAFIADGTVASSSVYFMVAALLTGILNRSLKPPLLALTAFGVVTLLLALYLGSAFPIALSALQIGSISLPPATLWVLLLMGYVFVASVTPVWLLLQPRDYLNSFLLYAMLLGAFAGTFVASPNLEIPAFTGFTSDTLGPMFPILFITVACGAISGFHSLVSSGSTSKQLNSERDAQFVGFGSMLLEASLAVVALIAVARLPLAEYADRLGSEGPIVMFGAGVGSFMSTLGIDESAATTFVALTVSAFALTTLDTCARLARFLFQEFFVSATEEGPAIGSASHPLATNRYLSTTVVVVFSAVLCFSGQFAQLWPVFGAANQLLAALALLAVGTWLANRGTNNLFVVIPMVFMYVVTISALVVLIRDKFTEGNYLLAAVSSVLLLLALELFRQAAGALRSPTSSPDPRQSPPSA